MKYAAEAGVLWRTYVPPRGQAATVQGELMRAVEKLRDEATRNGNTNWDAGHVILAEYLRDQLVGSGQFDAAAVREIESDVDALLAEDEPEASGAPYDRLTDRIVEWSLPHPAPVPHQPNPDLHR